METRIFQNPEPPAYFQATRKHFQVIPQLNPDSGRVEFLVIGEGIDRALQELYADAQVISFMAALKGLRSAIFTLKGGQR